MPDISKVTLPDNTTYDLIGKIGRGLLRAETDSTSTATAFVVNAPGVTELYEGLTLAIKNTVIASASGCTINVNGLGAKSIWRSLSNSLLTTQWALNTEYLFVYDATNDRWVIQQGYDTNDDVKAYTVYRQYTGYKSGEISVFTNTLIMQRPNGTWESIVTSSSTELDKTPNPHGFLLYDILYWSGATVAPNSVMGINDLVDQVTSRVDMRYSFNIANSAAEGFQTYTPVYIVGTLGNDGLFYLDNPWWTQTLPSTEDGKLYIYIGNSYDRYRMPFIGKHPIYRYANGMIRQYIPDSGTVNGHSVATDVPANAVFADTKVTQTVTTTSADYEILFSETADNTTHTEGARKNSNLKFNPSTGNLQFNILNGLNISSFTNNAGFHNSIYRGKSLGTSITSDQWTQISAGTFDDMYIGDYWTLSTTISGSTANRVYRIAAFDYWWNCGDSFPHSSNKHHVVLVPDANFYSATMNDTNITTGGYVGSKMYTTNLEPARTAMTALFGDHLYSVRKLFTTDVNSLGQATGWGWYTSTVDLMNENMVYGSSVWSTSGYETGVDRTILPLFALDPAKASIRANWWLRASASSALFAYVDNGGHASCGGASNSRGVRPAFAIF